MVSLKEEAKSLELLTESVKATIQSAARRLTGILWRQFQAKMAIKYCDGQERCGGILENHWNGTLLRTVGTAIA